MRNEIMSEENSKRVEVAAVVINDIIESLQIDSAAVLAEAAKQYASCSEQITAAADLVCLPTISITCPGPKPNPPSRQTFNLKV